MWFLIGLVVGACLGGAGIGWLFWNKKAVLQAEYDKLKMRLP